MIGEPTATVERYLALIADLDADPAEFERLVHPDARFVERPCLVSPRGQERDRAAAWAGLVHGRELLRAQRIEVRDHLVAGDRVVTRAVWTGTLAQPAGPLPAGAELRADCSMFFTVRDGRILAQENFDCYHPPRGLTFAYRRY
jgi:ketosteroid isomerase-like protein